MITAQRAEADPHHRLLQQVNPSWIVLVVIPPVLPAAMPPAGSLSAEQLSFFDANGYLVLESFSGEQDVRALRDRIAELVAGSDDGTQHHRVEVVDDYFSNSAENISFFYEDKAFGVDGCLKQPKELSIRFVGNDSLKIRMIKDENVTYFDRPTPSYDHKEFVPLEVRSGSLVVIHGNLVHKSAKNHSPTSRHALVLHVVDTEGCEWSKGNWIQR